MRKIAITRPYEDSLRVAEAWVAKGHECVIEPMLTIRTMDTHTISGLFDSPPQGIILTSRHAASALKHIAHWLAAAPCFVVGEATAAAASEAGAKEVIVAAGNAGSLLQVIRAHSTPVARLVYLRGKDVKMDIAGMLRHDGHHVDEVMAYEAVAATSFSDAYKQLLADGRIEAVLFYSERTAQLYVDIAVRSGLVAAHAQVKAYTISEGLAHTLTALGFMSILALPNHMTAVV